ncbi:MAG: DinB family protein [Balneolaceae bacterium]|nr:DinB family protein [Balneolaceae bacterium]
MKTSIPTLLSLLLLFAAAVPPAAAQQSGQSDDPFRAQFMRHFDYASRVLQLAEAMPAEFYDWRPGEGVYSVERVYTHIARYNYYYLENSLGIAAPEDVDVDNIESFTGKQQVVDILERSIKHVQAAVEEMPASTFTDPAQLYGQTVDGQAVLLQLITHMSEHVGQSIAYARMNDVVPPWSR